MHALQITSFVFYQPIPYFDKSSDRRISACEEISTQSVNLGFGPE